MWTRPVDNSPRHVSIRYHHCHSFPNLQNLCHFPRVLWFASSQFRRRPALWWIPRRPNISHLRVHTLSKFRTKSSVYCSIRCCPAALDWYAFPTNNAWAKTFSCCTFHHCTLDHSQPQRLNHFSAVSLLRPIMNSFADILPTLPRMLSQEPSGESKFFEMCGNLAKVDGHHSVDFPWGNIRTAHSIELKLIVIRVKYILHWLKSELESENQRNIPGYLSTEWKYHIRISSVESLSEPLHLDAKSAIVHIELINFWPQWTVTMEALLTWIYLDNFLCKRNDFSFISRTSSFVESACWPFWIGSANLIVKSAFDPKNLGLMKLTML